MIMATLFKSGTPAPVPKMKEKPVQKRRGNNYKVNLNQEIDK